jgi:UPF0755 protein
MKKFILILLLIAISCVIASAFLYSKINEKVTIERVTIQILPGESGREIIYKLYTNKIITNEKIFYYLIKFLKKDRFLFAGYYQFNGEFSMMDIIDKLSSGEIVVNKVTIPEGYSMYRTFKTLADNGIGNYERYLQISSNKSFLKEITGFDVVSIEGFLYPDTYFFGDSMSEENVIKFMIKNFFERLESKRVSIKDKDKLYKDIILASIVEKEVRHSDEKVTVAGVYHNRLAKGMLLQACPTATYYLEPKFIHANVVTYEMTKNNTPTNTYIHSGLPPHPICSPSVSSIVATQNPTNTNYLFFFAGEDGRHKFSVTYQEHLWKQKN